MNKKIRVTGIIRGKGGTLVLKQNLNQDAATVFWELPTGKIEVGEQPEEAMARVIRSYVGIKAKSIKLRDVVTFLTFDEGSQVNNLYIVFDVIVSRNKKPHPHDKYTSYKYSKDFSGMRLRESTMAVLDMEQGGAHSGASSRDAVNYTTIYVDGSSRGNPGAAGIGYCIYDENGKIIDRDGKFIGFATSRVAEYYALKEGIEQAIKHGYTKVRFMSDSLMVVNQINKIFKIHNKDIIPIHDDVVKLLAQLESYDVVHISRSQNSVADKEANIAIDRVMKNS